MKSPFDSLIETLEKGTWKPKDTAPQPPDDDLLEDLRRPFVGWLDRVCTLNSCWSGGLTCLYRSFCEWCTATGVAPCDIHLFELMLLELSFQIGEVSGVTLVLGLVFKADVESHEAFQNGGK